MIITKRINKKLTIRTKETNYSGHFENALVLDSPGARTLQRLKKWENLKVLGSKEFFQQKTKIQTKKSQIVRDQRCFGNVY